MKTEQMEKYSEELAGVVTITETLKQVEGLIWALMFCISNPRCLSDYVYFVFAAPVTSERRGGEMPQMKVFRQITMMG